MPAAVPGVAFLSGGQSAELASARLNAMNAGFKARLPWALAFSFSRAIQQPALDIWQGKEAKVSAAQQALLHRARYAIPRIAGTLGVLLLMTLSILVFNFYPVTSSRSSTFCWRSLTTSPFFPSWLTNVHYSYRIRVMEHAPGAGIATVISIIGVVGSFALFYFGERFFHLHRHVHPER